jgi:hypothetical protein
MKSVNEFDRDEIRAFERANDKWLPMTACSLIMAHVRGMPLRTRHIEFLDKAILEVIERSRGEPDEEAKIATPEQVANRPTIQDRLNERTGELIGELEGLYDDLDTNVKFYDWFVANNVVQSQLSKYENIYQRRRAELTEAQAKTDPQLKEAYAHFKAVDFKRHIAWIDSLLEAVEQYRGVKKAAKKARVKKAPSKEKLVAKLKYAKENKVLKVVSINPADIVGSAELYVYNVKTRKLGKYLAATYQTLSIKGTSITGYDPDKSVAKTLRKPEEQIKEFKAAGKIALRKFLDDIKAVDIKLNGRINEEVLLLKVA